MHTQNRVVQASRGRRVPRQQVTSARTNRRVGSRWRAAAVAMSLGCAAVLSACGGGGGGNAPAAQPASALPASAPVADSSPSATSQSTPMPVLIEEYGDSTTQGWQVANGVGEVSPNSEPADLQRLLQSLYGAPVTVSNQGVGGTEASQLLNGTDGVHPSWVNQMAQSKAQIVTLNFALNDAYYSTVMRDGVSPESPSEYALYMTRLVEVARSSGKQVVLYEPNATCDPVRAPLMPAYVAALQAVAKSQNVPIVGEYDATLALPQWQAMLTDCLHPDDALYSRKAQLEFPVVAPIVAGLAGG